MNFTTWSSSMVVDPQVWIAEQELVFASSWVAVARSQDLANSGDYVSTSVAGEPVVILRANDNSLSALSNVCRHRATTLVEGSGNSRALQCPNHRWTYDTQGKLLSAPSMDDAKDFDKADVCLPRFAVCEWQGWVLVNLGGEAAPLSVSTRHLDELLAHANFATMQRVGSLPFPSPWNWKLSVENFAESYHHQSVHPETLQPTFPGARSFVVDSAGEPWSWLDHVSTEEWAEPFTACVVFPTLMFSWIRPNAMAWFHLEPQSATHTNLTIEVFVQPAQEGSDSDGLTEILLASLQQINSEDIPINRRTFEGLHSRYATIGALSPLEGAVAQFRTWLLSQLATGRSIETLM